MTWDIELHNNKIKRIRNGAFKDLKLEMLLIFANEIEVVEEDAFSGSEDTLYVLHLYNNKLTSVPSAAGKMRKLMGLDIHNNPISTIREDVLRSVSSTLSGIMFGDTKMTSWPNSLNVLSNLDSITIENLNIARIPEDALTNFRNLSSFEMISTNVSNIPTSLGDRSLLEDINLIDNPMLTTESFEPKTFIKLPTLMRMTIMHSSITILPNIFRKLNNLFMLQLENNPITSIPDNVFNLNFSSSFWFMTLKNTSLASVPKALSNLTSLTRLDFMTSLITEIQDTDFSKMDKLERMYFTNSPLHTVSDNAFHGLKSLKYLTLDNTHLTAVPKATMNLPSLSELSLSNTKVVCTCTNLGWIKQWPRHSEVEIYGSCYNIRMTIALYVYKELPKC
ncbi:leucine-rich repeat protein soc-2 homolog [Mytilus californianus]|uniref:leucine-rich repeat protein soc-2 homolog n=1 Tax=Mytilus californianus TaxID=6549 RepID=UPI0022468A91|nr:leucine-rich repeat protein soc-2 homolog [Mytilus californianus]